MYFLATNVCSYGDKSPAFKSLSKGLKFALSGFAYGLAPIFILGVSNGLLQAFIAMLGFYVIYILDESNIIKNPWVELLRGVVGTIVFSPIVGLIFIGSCIWGSYARFKTNL
jgi:hypothetical protein